MADPAIPKDELCPGLWDDENCLHGSSRPTFEKKPDGELAYFDPTCFPHRGQDDGGEVFPADFGGGPGQHDSFLMNEMREAWDAYGPNPNDYETEDEYQAALQASRRAAYFRPEHDHAPDMVFSSKVVAHPGCPGCAWNREEDARVERSIREAEAHALNVSERVDSFQADDLANREQDGPGSDEDPADPSTGWVRSSPVGKEAYVVIYDVRIDEDPETTEGSEQYYGYFGDVETARSQYEQLRGGDAGYRDARICKIVEEIPDLEFSPEVEVCTDCGRVSAAKCEYGQTTCSDCSAARDLSKEDCPAHGPYLSPQD